MMKCKRFLRQMVYGGLIALLLTGCNGAQTEPPITPTLILSASTPIPSTPTPILPTLTPISPTPAPILPTSTPIPPTATPFVSPYDYDELIRTFNYDSEIPLDIREESVFEEDGIQIHSISYASPKGRVPAYLVVPPGDGPFAGIIFLHWGQGDRNEFVDEALLCAQMGAISLLIDGPFNRPDFALVDTGPGHRYTVYIQTVLDVRRGVDLLESRPDIDTDRIGYVGHSYGATWGGVLAGVEKRIKAYVLMAGYVQVSKTDGPNLPKIDAINYISHAAPSAVFFQFAEHDRYITKESALLFYQVASEPKSIQWYNTSHRLSTAAREDRVEWLSAQLDLERGQD